MPIDITLYDSFDCEFIKVTTWIVFYFLNPIWIEPLSAFKLTLEIIKIGQLDVEVLVFLVQFLPIVSVDMVSFFLSHLIVVVVVLLNFIFVCLEWILFY